MTVVPFPQRALLPDPMSLALDRLEVALTSLAVELRGFGLDDPDDMIALEALSRLRSRSQLADVAEIASTLIRAGVA